MTILRRCNNHFTSVFTHFILSFGVLLFSCKSSDITPPKSISEPIENQTTFKQNGIDPAEPLDLKCWIEALPNSESSLALIECTSKSDLNLWSIDIPKTKEIEFEKTDENQIRLRIRNTDSSKLQEQINKSFLNITHQKSQTKQEILLRNVLKVDSDINLSIRKHIQILKAYKEDLDQPEPLFISYNKTAITIVSTYLSDMLLIPPPTLLWCSKFRLIEDEMKLFSHPAMHVASANAQIIQNFERDIKKTYQQSRCDFGSIDGGSVQINFADSTSKPDIKVSQFKQTAEYHDSYIHSLSVDISMINHEPKTLMCKLELLVTTKDGQKNNVLREWLPGKFPVLLDGNSAQENFQKVFTINGSQKQFLNKLTQVNLHCFPCLEEDKSLCFDMFPN